MRTVIFTLLLCCTSCLQPGPDRREARTESWREYHGADLEPGQVISQAMLGVTRFETAERSGGLDPSVPMGTNDLEQLPLISGALQEALGGNEYFDYGWEGGAALGFVGGGGFIAASGSNGLIVAVDIDLLLVDLFLGPFISTNIGNRMRFYMGAGPLVDFASYSHQGEEGGTAVDTNGTGLGFGWYARGGAEVLVGDRYMLGVGYRWVDSSIALSGDLGTLDLVGSQMFLSLSTGF